MTRADMDRAIRRAHGWKENTTVPLTSRIDFVAGMRAAADRCIDDDPLCKDCVADIQRQLRAAAAELERA